jgi:hypothetical protein
LTLATNRTPVLSHDTYCKTAATTFVSLPYKSD